MHLIRSVSVLALLVVGLVGCGDQSGDITLARASVAATDSPVSVEQSSADSLKARFDSVIPILKAEVDADIRSGFVALAVEDGEVVMKTAIGMADREAAEPMRMDTPFRIASMTKPVTSVAILMLVEEGKLSLDDPLADFIPAFADTVVATSYSADKNGDIPTEPLKTPITIRQLLTHTAGLGYLFDTETDLGRVFLENSLYSEGNDLATRIDRLAGLPLYMQPGEKWLYSYATDVLGRVVEVVSGEPLDAFFNDRIFVPLRMEATKFAVEAADIQDAAVVYAHDKAGAIVKYEGNSLGRDPNTRGAGWLSGGGGLISTASDYMAFCQMLIDGGRAPSGGLILSEDSVNLLLADHVTPAQRETSWASEGISFGLAGWVGLVDPENASSKTTTGAFGWGGYYDTSFAINRQAKTAFVVLAQREPGPYDKPSKAGDLMLAALFNRPPTE